MQSFPQPLLFLVCTEATGFGDFCTVMVGFNREVTLGVGEAWLSTHIAHSHRLGGGAGPGIQAVLCTSRLMLQE